jgi:hypothetical protein
MKDDPSLDRKKALEQASMISGHSFRSEGAQDTARAKLLQQMRDKDVEYKLYGLQKSMAKTPEEAVKFARLLEQKESEYLSRLPGASSQAGASTIPEGVTIKKIGS